MFVDVTKDMSIAIMFGAGDAILAATEIVVLTDAVIDFGFVFEVAFTITILTIGTASNAAEVNDSGWTAVLTALELTLASPAPPEESLLAW